MPEQSAHDRAMAAAEELSAEGVPVTARAVRERARVSLNVATPVAKEWKSREAQTREVPAMPDSVVLRVDALWRTAVEVARAEHQAERDGLLAQVREAEEERSAALEDVTAAEASLDEARGKIDQMEHLITTLREAVTVAEQRVAAAEARAVHAEQRTMAAEGVAAGLREALDAVSEKSKR